MPTTRSKKAIHKDSVQSAKTGANRKKVAADVDEPLPGTLGDDIKLSVDSDDNKSGKEHGEKREVQDDDLTAKIQPPNKRMKTESEGENTKSKVQRGGNQTDTDTEVKDTVYEEGTIDRGHVYFFYRPKVEVTEVESFTDIQRFHMLLVPRPPAFSVPSPAATSSGEEKPDPDSSSALEMKVLEPGADAVPAPPIAGYKKKYRLLTFGKKKLPEQKGKGFWGVITDIGNDLESLEKGLDNKDYDTKTRGRRHQGSARLVARGAYAIVNTSARTPSARKTYFGYRLSHPSQDEFGDVQTSLGLHPASTFVVQIKNPLAPGVTAQQAHTHGKEADYPEWIIRRVFQGRGKDDFGLRFSTCEVPEMLDYIGAQVLLLPSRQGEEGLETSLGEGRGEALNRTEDKEEEKSIDQVFEELGLDLEKFPAEPLEGKWI